MDLFIHDLITVFWAVIGIGLFFWVVSNGVIQIGNIILAALKGRDYPILDERVEPKRKPIPIDNLELNFEGEKPKRDFTTADGDRLEIVDSDAN